MAKIIVCKTCGKEIAKSAKACPHCGAKQKPGCLRSVLAVFLLLFGIAMILGALGGEENPTKVPGESQPVTQAEQPTDDPVFTVGDTVEMRDIYVTLIDVYEFSGDFMQPQDGIVFVAFELLIENKSDDSVAVSSLLCFEAYFDDFVANYNIGAQAESGKNQLDGEIAPGKKMTGAICYEVPEDWTTTEINIDLGISEFTFTYNK